MTPRCCSIVKTKLLAQQLSAAVPSAAACRAVSMRPIPILSSRYYYLMRNTNAFTQFAAVRTYSAGATSSGNGAETQTEQKAGDKDNEAVNDREDSGAGEATDLDRLRSELDSKEKEIVDLKVR